MRFTHGASFETPGGVWRKEYVEADESEFSGLEGLSEDVKVMYVMARLEQRLLGLRWMFGNLSEEMYRDRWQAIEIMCTGWLTPKAS